MILLACFDQAGFRVGQRMRGLFGRQHRFGGGDADFEFGGDASDKAVEHVLGLIGVAGFGEDLAAAQFIVVAAFAVVVFAVVFFAVVEVIEGSRGIAVRDRGRSRRMIEKRIAVGLVGARRPRGQRLSELAGQLARIELEGGDKCLIELGVGKRCHIERR